MHDAAFYAVGRMLAATGRRPGLVVEIGGKNINGSVRALFGEPYVAVDVRPGPGVDVVGDGATYRPESPASMVVCCEVLEHTPDGAAICANAFEMLESGGVYILTAAGEGRQPHSAVDGGPLPDGEFYANVTRAMLEAWLAPFAGGTIAENQTTGDIYAVAVKA